MLTDLRWSSAVTGCRVMLLTFGRARPPPPRRKIDLVYVGHQIHVQELKAQTDITLMGIK